MQRALVLPQMHRAIDESVEATLLDLVRAVSEETDDPHEVVAAVLHLLRTGRIRLSGSFRGHRL